jgi:plastocyanin
VLVRDLRRGGPARAASRASGAHGALADEASSDAAISADGRRVAFTSAATNLSGAKPDDRRGVFVRDLRSHATTLVSAPAPKAAATAAPPAPGGSVAAPTTGAGSSDGGSADRSSTRAATVSIFDNAFFRGSDRPTVHLRARGVLTWRWSSQQSHQVTVRSGPKILRSPTKSQGTYSVRLEQPGTYQFVCAIHAPGMRMTAVVR